MNFQAFLLITAIGIGLAAFALTGVTAGGTDASLLARAAVAPLAALCLWGGLSGLHSIWRAHRARKAGTPVSGHLYGWFSAREGRSRAVTCLFVADGAVYRMSILEERYDLRAHPLGTGHPVKAWIDAGEIVAIDRNGIPMRLQAPGPEIDPEEQYALPPGLLSQLDGRASRI
ncbi:hypothetical protein [Erythrobacter sp. EC-HK427]|uniref:hypothetical protein n=1 Tax=Erythrobacter sp. EC-HK427 TaxID=2038396 RepID=UPI00125A9BE3|nr:hypothetical protein [Erythrobacter sp. EC-HK427]VVT09583.1 hypothetical protein ERY430_50020 [Erythrobacter sp. EC-HK427]